MTGVSLIESMITIAILGLLVALAMPAIGDWLLNTRLRNAAESIQNGLQMARAEAVRCNVPVEFVLDPAYDSSWTIQFAFPALPTPCRDAIPAAQWPVVQARPAEEGSRNALLDPTLIRARWAQLAARPDQHLAKQVWALLAFAVWNTTRAEPPRRAGLPPRRREDDVRATA